MITALAAPAETAALIAPRCQMCQKPLSWRDNFAATCCALVCRACRQRATETRLRGTWRPATIMVKDAEGRTQQIVSRQPSRKARREEATMTPTEKKRQAALNQRAPRYLRSLAPTY